MKRREFILRCASGATLFVSGSAARSVAEPYTLAECFVQSRTGFGTGSLYRLTSQEASHLINRAYDLGITLFDTAAAYGQGECETLLGRVLPHSEATLVTKTLHRSKDKALLELDGSLRRLKRDAVDVWMLHDLRTAEEWNTAISAHGIIAAAEEAKRAGKIRRFGISAHRNPALLAKAVAEAQIDVVMLPVHTSRFWPDEARQSLYPVLEQKGVLVIGMKVFQESKEPALALRSAFAQPINGIVAGFSTIEEITSTLRVMEEVMYL